MAKIKVTPSNIKTKIQAWGNVTDPLTADTFVFLPSDGIDTNEIIMLGWKNNIIIEVQNDVGQFMKFVYKEKVL